MTYRRDSDDREWKIAALCSIQGLLGSLSTLNQIVRRPNLSAADLPQLRMVLEVAKDQVSRLWALHR